MADQRLTDKDLLTDPVGADLMHVVDVSDTTGSAAGTSKQITLSSAVVAGAGAPANEIIINSEADFEEQTNFTITLKADKVYVPGASIVFTKNFIVETNVVIRCRNQGILWEYEGLLLSGAFFSGTNVISFRMFNMSFRVRPPIALFNFSDTNPLTSRIELEDIFGSAADANSLICDTVATFTNVADVTLKNIGMREGIGVNNGIKFLGTQANALIADAVLILSESATFVALDLGSVLFNGIVRVDTLVGFGLAGGSVAIKGLADSANISPGRLATFDNCVFFGLIDPLEGISESDIRYRFRNSFPIPDSTIDYFTSMTVAQTVTITTSGEFIPIAGGNWVATKSNRWSVDPDGVATFLFEGSTDVKLESNCSITKDGGGSDSVAMRINVDTGGGFPVPPPIRTQSETKSTDPTNITSADLVTINEGDKVRIEVANLDSTSNVLVSANARFLSLNGF